MLLRRKLFLAGAGLATVLCAPAIAGAQDDAAPTANGADRERIVVTARRREESVSEVPISIAVIEGDLTRQSITTNSDLQFSVPGLTFTGIVASREDPPIQLRGQGQTFGAALPGVTSYFADVPIFGSNSSLFDMNSIQVLRGPQGTLFGRNTTGGAILFTPAAPVIGEFEGHVLGRFGNLGLNEVQGAINVPLGERAAIRIAGSRLRRDGYTDDLTTGLDLDDQNRDAWRVGLRFEPTDNIETQFTFAGLRVRQNGNSEIIYSAPAAGAAAAFFGADAFLAQQQANGNRTTWSVPGFAPFFDRDYFFAANTTTVDFGDVTIRNIIGYQEDQSGFQVNFGGFPLPILHQRTGPHLLNPNNALSGRSQLSEEFHIFGETDLFTWLVGASYIHEEPLGLRVSAVEVFGGGSDDLNLFSVEQEDVGVFGQTTIDLSAIAEGVSLTAGARYSVNEQNAVNMNGSTPTRTSAPYGPFTCDRDVTLNFADCQVPLSEEFSGWSWNLTLDWQVGEDTLLYAATRRGFKAGGFNATAINAADALYGSEELTDVELGFRTRWDAGPNVSLDANIAVYYGWYEQIQRYFLTVLPGNVTQTLTVNAGDGSVSGLEFQGGVMLFDDLELRLNYAYTNAEITPDPALGAFAPTGYAGVAEHAGSFIARYHLPIEERLGDLSLAATIYAQSEMPFVDDINVEPQAHADPYTLLNLRADWENVADSAFDLAVFVDNATDEEYLVDGAVALDAELGLSVHSFGPPRVYGLELRYNF